MLRALFRRALTEKGLKPWDWAARPGRAMALFRRALTEKGLKLHAPIRPRPTKDVSSDAP